MLRWLAVAGLLVWLSFEFLLRQPGEARRVSAPTDVSRSTQLLIGTYLVVLFISAIASIVQLAPIPPAIRWISIVILVIGLALRGWAMVSLHNSYSRALQVTEQQSLMTGGPYRVIRHPGYAGSLLIWIGFASGLGSWVATLFATVLLGAAYIYRIVAEERMLGAQFGAAYLAYRRSTWRLIPGLF